MSDDQQLNIDWQKMNGLMPAIVQDFRTGNVLMLGYMNQDAMEKSLATKQVCFYSRTKQKLWTKGETSGNFLKLVRIATDCDGDSLLVQAIPTGPTCHLGSKSCYGEHCETELSFVAALEKIITERRQQPTDKSYTAHLFSQGVRRIAQKVGEEGVEVALAAVAQGKQELIAEATDLLFHLLILLQACDLQLKDIVVEAEKRHVALSV